MKERLEFVSNSSSSSYVVRPDDMQYRDMDKEAAKLFTKGLCSPTEDGKWNGLFLDYEAEFGWQRQNYREAEVKWNWLVLQAYYDGGKYREIVEQYVRKFVEDCEIDWGDIASMESRSIAYIDHQSVDAKSTFEAVETVGISQFLVNNNCYIRNGNDNDDDEGDDEY